MPFDSAHAYNVGTGAYQGTGHFDYQGGGAAPQPQPDRRPMGFVGISFRRRKRQDEEEAVQVAVDMTETANQAEVAQFVETKLEQVGVEGKDIAGLILRGELSSKVRRELESLLAFREAEDLPGAELERFLDEQREITRRKRNIDAALAIMMAGEL